MKQQTHEQKQLIPRKKGTYFLEQLTSQTNGEIKTSVSKAGFRVYTLSFMIIFLIVIQESFLEGEGEEDGLRLEL